jgi:hypothetical protein
MACPAKSTVPQRLSRTAFVDDGISESRRGSMPRYRAHEISARFGKVELRGFGRSKCPKNGGMLGRSQPIDQAGHKSSAKAVINIHDGDI